MKKVILLIIIIYVSDVYSQNEKSFFIEEKQSYAILLDNDIKVSKKDLKGTEVSVFVKTNESGFNYTLLITKIYEHNFPNGNLMDKAYEKYNSSTCSCTIIDEEVVQYNNLKTLRYKIKVIDKENVFIGYNDSFVSNGLLYNVLFLTFENDFNEQQKKYHSIIDSFLINGRTTIDNYKENEVIGSK